MTLGDLRRLYNDNGLIAELKWTQSTDWVWLNSIEFDFRMLDLLCRVFTTANDSPNLAHCLLMAFSDLEKQKYKSFWEKHDAGARTNIM